MLEVVISGDPHDIYRLFCGCWRHGFDESEVGAEEFVAWQVAAGIYAEDKGTEGARDPLNKAAAGKAADIQATANELSAERATADIAEAAQEVATEVSLTSTGTTAAMQTAAAKPPVGSKRRVPSILALLTARVSSEVASASSEVGPGGTEVAKKVALQGDRASKGEINPEGSEVAESKRPQASRGEVAGDHSTPSPTMVGVMRASDSKPIRAEGSQSLLRN